MTSHLSGGSALTNAQHGGIATSARCAPPGVATNNITGKRYIDHWTEAGFECGTPIKNSGADAAMMRMEAARRVFPRRWFNETTTEAGRDALGYYHERQDEKRGIGLGPEYNNARLFAIAQ